MRELIGVLAIDLLLTFPKNITLNSTKEESPTPSTTITLFFAVACADGETCGEWEGYEGQGCEC